MRIGDQSTIAALTSHQLRLLGLMAEAARLTPEVFLKGVVCSLSGVSGYGDLDEARFNVIADGFVGIGFRHPALPILSRAQRACLDRCRRRLGLSGRETRAFYRNCTGVASTRLMTGGHFLGLMAVFEIHGVAEPHPAPVFMDRHRAAAVRRRAWQAGLCEHGLRDLFLKLGGTFTTRGLDERAYGRVIAAIGGMTPEPAPEVQGEPGMMMQAQANVIWRLWCDSRRGQDAGEQAFDKAIGVMLDMPGLDTLTRAGANIVMARLKTSLVSPSEQQAGVAVSAAS